MAKKKSLFAELVEKRAIDDRKFTTLNASRWSFGYQVFRANLVRIVLLNFLLLISAVPIILFLVRRYAVDIYQTMTVNPLSSNMGFGIMPYTSTGGLEQAVVLNANKKFFIIFPFLSIVFGLGLSGALYVTRNMLWLNDDIKVMRDFFVGIKKNWGVAVLTFVFAVILSVCFMSISYADYTAAINGGSWLNTFTKVVCYIAIGLFGLMYLNAVVMSVTYKVKFFGLLKNSFLIAPILLPIHVFILAIALIPFLLIPLGNLFMAFGLAIILFFGLEYFVLVWSCYSHWIYEKFLQGATIENNQTGAQSKKQTSEAEAKEIESKTAVINILPIKPFSAEDPEIRQLPIVFALSDIEAVMESKQNMRADSDAYAEKVKAEQDANKQSEANDKTDKKSNK